MDLPPGCSLTTDELIEATFPDVIGLYESQDPVVHIIAARIEDEFRKANNDLCSAIYDRETH
jgi:hypothetical protein